MEKKIVRYIFAGSSLKRFEEAKRCERLLKNVIHNMKISFIEISYAVLVYKHYYRRLKLKEDVIDRCNILCVSLIMANKLINDRPYKNIVWANALKIPLRTMNRLELSFLTDLKFRIIPTGSVFMDVWSVLFYDV